MDPDFNNANPGLCPLGALKITLPIRQLQLFIDMWKHSQLDANKINVSYDVNVRLKRNFHNPEIGCERKSFQTFVSDSIWTICMENDQICFSVSKLAPKTGPYQHVECSIAEVVKFRFNDSCVIQKKTLNEKEFSSLFSKDTQKEVNSEFRMYGTDSVVHYNDESSCSGDNGSTQNYEDKIQCNNKAHFDERKTPFKDRITDGNKTMPFEDTKSESDTENMDDEENKLVIDIQDASSSKSTTPGDNRFDEKCAQTVSGIDIDKSDIVMSKPRKVQISPAVISKAIDKEKSRSESRAVVDISSGNSDMEKKKTMVIEIMDSEMEIIEIDNNDNDNCGDKNVDEKDKDEEKNEVGGYQDDEVVKEEEEKEKEHHGEVKENHEWEEVEGEEEGGQDNCKEVEGEKELRQDKSKEVGEEKNNVLYVKHKCTRTSLSNPVVGGSNSNSERVLEKKDTTSMQSLDKFPLSECFEEEFECDVWNDDLMNVVMMDIVTEAMKNKTKDDFKPKGKGLQSRPQIQEHVENEQINSGGKTDATGKSKANSCSGRTYDDEIFNQVSQNQTDVAKIQSQYNHDQNKIDNKQLEKGDSPISHNYPCQKDRNDIEWIKIEINPDFRDNAVESVHDGAPNEERNSRNQNNSLENEKCVCPSVDLSKVKTEPMDDYESTDARSGSNCADSAHLASAFTSNKISDFSNTKKEMSSRTSFVANTTTAGRKDMTGKEITLVKNITENFRFQDISHLPLTAQTSQSISAPLLTAQTSQCIGAPPWTAQISQCISTPPLTAQTSQCISAPLLTAQTSQCISAPPRTAQTSQCISAPPWTAQTSQCISTPPLTAQTSQCISTPPLTALTSQNFRAPQLIVQASQGISTPQQTAQTSQGVSIPRLTAHASQGISTPRPTARTSQGISTPPLIAQASQGISYPPLTAHNSHGINDPPLTAQTSQGISTPPLTAQTSQGVSTPQLTAQASQGISTPQLTAQTVTKTSFKLPTILQQRNVPMKVVPIVKSAPPEGLQISPVMYKCIPISGLILNQPQTSKQGPNPSNPPLHQHLQMSFSAKESTKSSFSYEPLMINSSSRLQLRTSVHCGVAKDSSIASVQNSQMKSVLTSQHLDKTSHPFDKTSHPLDKTSPDLDKASHPLDKTSHPIDKTSHPFDKTSHPLDKTSHALDMTSHPFDKTSHPLDKSTSNSYSSMKPIDAATVATVGSKANDPSSVSMPTSVNMPTSVSMPDIHSIRSCSSSFMIMKKTPQDIYPDEEQIINSEKDVEIVWDNLSQTGDQSKTLGLVWASGMRGEAGHGKDSSPTSDGKSQKGSFVKEKTALPSDPSDGPCTRLPCNLKPCDLEKESCNDPSCSSTRLTSVTNTLLKAYGPKSHQVKKGKSDRKRPSSERPLAGINISKMECFWSKKRRTLFTGTITSFGRIMERLADRDLDYQIHDSDRLVECINCKEFFISEQDFMYHMVDFEIYINKSSCRCKCCKLRFPSHELLNSHFQLHSVFKSKNGNEINLDREYECKHCDELFCTHRMKLEHDLMEHSLGQVHANLCSECNRAFPNRNWLHMHYKLCCPSQKERLPLLSFRCQYCGSEFSEEGHRNHHEESCMKVSIHHCPYCGIAMSKLLPMAFHISFVHYKVKMICCTENDCSLQFESPFRQMCHRIVDHLAPYVVHQLEESQPLFRCQLCRRAIYSVLELYDHLSARCRWPHGKWFNCKICELKFLSHKAVACHTCCVHPVEEL